MSLQQYLIAFYFCSFYMTTWTCNCVYRGHGRWSRPKCYGSSWVQEQSPGEGGGAASEACSSWSLTSNFTITWLMLVLDPPLANSPCVRHYSGPHHPGCITCRLVLDRLPACWCGSLSLNVCHQFRLWVVTVRRCCVYLRVVRHFTLWAAALITTM